MASDHACWVYDVGPFSLARQVIDTVSGAARIPVIDANSGRTGHVIIFSRSRPEYVRRALRRKTGRPRLR